MAKTRVTNFEFDGSLKTLIFPSWREGMKGTGINNLLEFLDSSPSPQLLSRRGRRPIFNLRFLTGRLEFFDQFLQPQGF